MVWGVFDLAEVIITAEFHIVEAVLAGARRGSEIFPVASWGAVAET